MNEYTSGEPLHRGASRPCPGRTAKRTAERRSKETRPLGFLLNPSILGDGCRLFGRRCRFGTRWDIPAKPLLRPDTHNHLAEGTAPREIRPGTSAGGVTDSIRVGNQTPLSEAPVRSREDPR